jgi:hypothetical protein
MNLQEHIRIVLKEEIISLKDNPVKYRQRCLEIQEHAKSYDWKYVIDKWVSILS